MEKNSYISIFKFPLLVLLVSIALIFSINSRASASSFNEYYQKVNDQVAYIQTNNSIPDKGSFFLRRIVSKTDYTYWTSFRIPGDSGTLRYFDSEKNLVQLPMVDGNLPQGRILFLSTDRYNYIIGQPYTYRDLGTGTKESVSSQPIHLRKDGDGWIATFRYSLSPRVHGILWGAGSASELVDFNNADQLRMWSTYDLDRNARLLYDGYHYKSPSTYYPSTPNSYWRIPSDYLTNSLVGSGGSLASEIIGRSLLIVAQNNINDQGFIPTLPRSNWLYSDYGIESGFFDTRFNADTIESNIIAYRKFGDEAFKSYATRLADYYMEHGKNKHFLVSDPIIGEGWLVEDYSHPTGRKNHMSLNHQLQAIHSFLLLYETEKNPEYLDFAQKMLNGVKITRDRWIKPDGNLEYAYMPDARMGLIDYDYLTYNDLLNVQDSLIKIKGERDRDLDILIETKRLWMDRNNVSGYKKTTDIINPS